MRLFSMLVFFLIMTTNSLAQAPVQCNQFDQSGKKTGFWRIFLNDRLIPVEDSTIAWFAGFDFYDMGIEQSYFTDCKKDKKHSPFVLAEGEKGEKGRPKNLDGVYTFFDKKEHVTLRQEFRNGYAARLEAFGVVPITKSFFHEVITFDLSAQGLGSYHYENFDKDNKLVRSAWFRKKDGVWIFEKE